VADAMKVYTDKHMVLGCVKRGCPKK